MGLHSGLHSVTYIQQLQSQNGGAPRDQSPLISIDQIEEKLLIPEII
jgi:hypothetical protein